MELNDNELYNELTAVQWITFAVMPWEWHRTTMEAWQDQIEMNSTKKARILERQTMALDHEQYWGLQQQAKPTMYCQMIYRDWLY